MEGTQGNQPEPAENPTTEQPETRTPDPQEAAQALLSELEAMNIKDAGQLQGMANASQQAGNLARLLGDERAQNQALRTRLEALESQVRQKPIETAYDEEYYDSPQEKPVTVKDLDAWLENKQKIAMQAQQQYWQALAEIQSDPDYQNEHIQQVWNGHINNPGVQARVQSGSTSIQREWDKVRTQYYRAMLQRSTETIRGLTNLQPGRQAKPPHMESGDTHRTPLPDQDDERKERITKLKQGERTEENIDKLIREIIPDNDPILQT